MRGDTEDGPNGPRTCAEPTVSVSRIAFTGELSSSVGPSALDEGFQSESIGFY